MSNNMLNNGGFEEGLPGWQIWSNGTTHTYIYPQAGRNNKGKSIAIEYLTVEPNKRAAWVQNIQIDPKNKYKLSGWLRTQNIITDNTNIYGASIILDWKDKDWKYLSTSPIMTRQTGTVRWTYFEGEVIPHPDATNATIILDLLNCSGRVLFDDISFSISSTPPTPNHPNMYLNQTEIDIIKSRLSQEPWRSAYSQFIGIYVPEALLMPIQSVVYGGQIPPGGDKHIYWTSDDPFAPTADRVDYQAAIKVGKAIRHLGLAYSLTNDSSRKIQYADKAIQLINGWCLDPATFMRPRFGNYNSQIELAITMPGIFYGADLIWNYTGWNSTNKDSFKKWVKQLIDIAKSKDWCHSPTYCQNHENWRLVLIASGSTITEDFDTLQYVFNRWKELIPQQIDSSGRMTKERDRQEKSLFYSTYAINAMIQTAEIARHYSHHPELGIDLYNYKISQTDNRGLERVLDYHTYYLAHPEQAIPPEWPTAQTYRIGANASIYELGYTFKKKFIYKNVIDKWERPMYEERVMGPITLTHGSI